MAYNGSCIQRLAARNFDEARWKFRKFAVTVDRLLMRSPARFPNGTLVKANKPVTGSISWSPSVTGELICALLGLPVVLLGIGLLVRSHFRDTQLPYQTIQSPDIQREPCHR